MLELPRQWGGTGRQQLHQVQAGRLSSEWDGQHRLTGRYLAAPHAAAQGVGEREHGAGPGGGGQRERGGLSGGVGVQRGGCGGLGGAGGEQGSKIDRRATGATSPSEIAQAIIVGVLKK